MLLKHGQQVLLCRYPAYAQMVRVARRMPAESSGQAGGCPSKKATLQPAECVDCHVAFLAFRELQYIGY